MSSAHTTKDDHRKRLLPTSFYTNGASALWPEVSFREGTPLVGQPCLCLSPAPTLTGSSGGGRRSNWQEERRH